jgi:hypothetical protein
MIFLVPYLIHACMKEAILGFWKGVVELRMGPPLASDCKRNMLAFIVEANQRGCG